MEPFMEPSGSEPVLEASEMDAFAGKSVGCRRADMSRTRSHSAVTRPGGGSAAAAPRGHERRLRRLGQRVERLSHEVADAERALAELLAEVAPDLLQGALP